MVELKNYVFVIYFLIGIIYLLHSGIQIPGNLDDFLHKNHHIAIFLLATCYLALSLLYLFKNAKETDDVNTKYKRWVAASFVGLIWIYFFSKVIL